MRLARHWAPSTVPQARPVAKLEYSLPALSLAGVALVLFSTSRYGAGITTDSVYYISAARHLLAGKGYSGFDGDLLAMWPPLFPSLMAFVGLAGLDPLDSVRYLNAVSFGLTIFVASLWLLDNVRSRVLALLGPVLILFSPALLFVSAFAWSESLFVLFVVLFLLEMRKFLERGRASSLFILAALAALACLTRYIGITVVATGLVIFLFRRNAALTRRLMDAIVFGVVSLAPLAMWLTRNYLVSSSLTGERAPSSYSVIKNIYIAAYTVAAWFLPSEIPPVPRILIIGSVLASLCAGATLIMRTGRRTHLRSRLLQVMPVVCFLLIYTVYLLVQASTVALNQVDNRLLAPIYVPLIVLVLFLTETVWQSQREHSVGHATNPLLLAGLGLWLVFLLVSAGRATSDRIQNGVGGWSTNVWKNSEVIQVIRQLPLGARVYSNAPDALYILSGVAADLSPRKHAYNSPRATTGDVLELRKSLESGGNVYLVWFENARSEWLYTIEELHDVLDLEPVARASDGAIFLIRRNAQSLLPAREMMDTRE